MVKIFTNIGLFYKRVKNYLIKPTEKKMIQNAVMIYIFYINKFIFIKLFK